MDGTLTHMEHAIAMIGVVALMGSGIALPCLSGAVALQWYETRGYRSDPYYYGD
jgi:hypothetical protein